MARLETILYAFLVSVAGSADSLKNPAHILPTVDTSQFKCRIDEGAPLQALREIAIRNCDKVSGAVRKYNQLHELHQVEDGFQGRQWEVWRQTGSAGSALCALSEKTMHANRTWESAYYALNAWGTIMMRGRECCNLNSPPFCVDTVTSISTIAVLFAVITVISLFVGAAIGSVFIPNAYRVAAKASLDGAEPPPRDVAPQGFEPVGVGPELARELEDAWVRRSCLRALPDHQKYAHATAVLFAALHERFDFQADNVRNQHENLLSMWRSTCAMVADRYLENGDVVCEATLLKDALEDLWTETLEGFRLWRDRLYSECPHVAIDSVSSDSEGDLLLPSLGGAMWYDADGLEGVNAQYLAELATFLLVWGEAGNVRFMPEVLYFLTELTLTADDARSCGALYGNAPRWLSEASGHYRSGLFLSKVIRPIYNVVFSEWYESVEGTGDTKDKKTLRKGFENFLPADAANYDDWDELFCDPPRFVERIVLFDGAEKLFELPAGLRFKALCSVDWARSLSSAKTHREVHSLWGVFASTHRVVLLHMLMFFSAMIVTANEPPIPFNNEVPLGGQVLIIRFAALGLLGPLHGFLWSFAQWETSGIVQRKHDRRVVGLCLRCGRTTLFVLPLLSYALVRYLDCVQTIQYGPTSSSSTILSEPGHLRNAICAHYIVSAVTFYHLLFCPSRSADELFKMTHVPLRLRAIRDIFWFCLVLSKWTMALFIFRQVFIAFKLLDISMVGQETYSEISAHYMSTSWCAHFLLWLMVWSMTLLLFIGDTQLWFTLGCSILGTLSWLVQRRCKVVTFALEDAVANLPERFSKKVLTYSPTGLEAKALGRVYDRGDDMSQFSLHFPAIWDRIVEYMRYEDKIDNQLRGDMSFSVDCAGENVDWRSLAEPIHKKRGGICNSATVKLPSIFRGKTACEALFQDLNSRSFGPSNPEVQWRLKALSRGLGLPMPRPYRAPYIPGITVLIPHYGESILLERDEIFKEDAYVPLIDWVKTKYDDEFRAFTSRYNCVPGAQWPVAGSQWVKYSPEQWTKIALWTSMRMQTLWRTVAGMWLYYPALQVHYEVQADRQSALAQPEIWDPADCFTLLVSMQMYQFFNKTQYDHTSMMFEKFPHCLKVAYIGCEDKNSTGAVDRVHGNQERRYFSCLIDSTSKRLHDGRMVPKLRIELPGYPILGDGKGDNQNHAIPFMRGLFNQCIDANQGAYFEQMLLLPCALGEFRTRWKGDTHSRRIIGFPEHITSDIGSIGDFAASAELAFGTLLQRSYAVLGARMHYGHPDLMSKIYMMQQGGVSKATKTLNLSEDIFAGMDFTLRGGKRKIRHCEYFHLAKGRDLGFNSVLGFFSKLSSGAGEQILTRQMFRLHQLFHLPESLTFFYAHVGYYFTQFFVSASLPMLVFTWLLMLLSDCNSNFVAFESCKDVNGEESGRKAAGVMADMLSVWFSFLLSFFLLVTNLPLFLEVWMQTRFITALTRLLKQIATLSPLLFIFQSKSIGFYVMNELRYGGATYVATGRGLPTERRHFIGRPASTGFRLEQVGGLYLDYAHIAYYDGMQLLMTSLMVLGVGGVSKVGEAGHRLLFLGVSISLTVISWLYAPFIFNPYQFDAKYFSGDLRAWLSFFLEDGGCHWVKWYNANHLKPRQGMRHSIIDISFAMRVFWVVVWFTAMNVKLHIFYVVYNESPSLSTEYMAMLSAPVWLSFAFCVLVGPLEKLVGCSRRELRIVKRRFQGRLVSKSETDSSDSDSSDAVDTVDLESLEAVGPEPHSFARDQPVVNDVEEPDENACGCSCRGTPMAFIAMVVIGLDIIEGWYTLIPMIRAHWTHGIITGVVLKCALLGMLLWMGEGAVKSKLVDKVSFFAGPLKTWVYSHRMARDLITSSFIFFTLSFFVILNSLNEACLPGCSIHQLLIYRDPGHLKRTEAIVVDAFGWNEVLRDASSSSRDASAGS